MSEFLGWPIVTASNCFEVIRKLGIVPWPKISDTRASAYLEKASEAQKAEYERFGPQVFVSEHRNPHTGEPFNGFRAILKPAAMVFAPIEGYLPVTAEWKHGNARITICPVAGVPGKAEAGLPTLADQMEAVALREYKEETGVELERVERLGPKEGIFSVVRTIDVRYFPYLGTVKRPIEKGVTKFDDTEHLKMVVFPIGEWLTLMESENWDQNPDFGLETYTRDVTYAALRKMGKLIFA